MFWPEAMASLSRWSSPRACRDFHCTHNHSPAGKPWEVCRGSSDAKLSPPSTTNFLKTMILMLAVSILTLSDRGGTGLFSMRLYLKKKK